MLANDWRRKAVCYCHKSSHRCHWKISYYTGSMFFPSFSHFPWFVFHSCCLLHMHSFIFLPFGISLRTENNVLFVFYSFPLYIKWRSFPGHWYSSPVLPVTSYIHHMLVTVHCLTFKVLSIEVLATIQSNIVHNLNFQLTLF